MPVKAETAKTRSGVTRREVTIIHKLLEEALTIHNEELCSFKDGHSDSTVAMMASKRLTREIPTSAVARLRKQTIGKIPDEGRKASSEYVVQVSKRMDEVLKRMLALEDRLSVVERDLYHDPSLDQQGQPSPSSQSMNGHDRH